MGREGTSQNQQASDAYYNAQTNALNSSMAQTAKFNSDANTLKSGQNIGANPFATPAYLQNENTSAATAAGSTADAAKASIADNALRTGDNSASSLYAIKNNQRTAQQDANTALLGQKSQDYLNNLGYQQGLLGNDLGTVSATNQLYGTATGGLGTANSNLTQLGLASYGPLNSTIGALGLAGAAAIKGVGGGGTSGGSGGGGG